jgi:hypothetical protein
VTEKQFEKTAEHLLALHARAEARMDRLDRQLQATANLVRAGVNYDAGHNGGQPPGGAGGIL